MLAGLEEEEYVEEEGEEEQMEFAENQEQEYEHDEGEEEEQEEDSHGTEEQRPLGRFMSPQVPRIARQPRLSLGVGAAPNDGPRRVRLVTPWKVNEIEVPAPVKEEDGNVLSRSSMGPPQSTPRSPVKKEKLTEEEREVSSSFRKGNACIDNAVKAIRARRRSALATPDDFFKGQAPGSRRTLFPSLASVPRPNFSETDESASATSSLSQDSTQDVSSAGTSSSTSTASTTKSEEQEDTAVLLARMQQMVESVKQRQSLGRQSLSLSPRKREGGFSLLAPNHASTHRPSRILIEEDEEMQDDDDDEPEMPALSRPATNTPRMSDLRHVFSRPQGNAGTPSFTGVREMFRPPPQDAVGTPRLDGVHEMLRTPAGYRAPLAEEDPAPADDDHDEAAEEDSVDELPVRNARGKRTPAARTSRRTPVPQSAPAKSTRAASQVPEDAPEAEAVPEKSTARRTRARTADGAVTQVCAFLHIEIHMNTEHGI